MTKFEAGREYKTRDGRRARVYATDGGEKLPIHGAVEDEESGWGLCSWLKDGSFYMCINKKSSFDLMPTVREYWIIQNKTSPESILSTSRSMEAAEAVMSKYSGNPYINDYEIVHVREVQQE